MADDEPFDADKSLAFLRSHGVEVETVEDREKKRAAAAAASASDISESEPFTYVKIPAEGGAPVEELRGAYVLGAGDALPTLLAPRFADDDGALDEEVVARETAGAMKGMVLGGEGGNTLKTPSVDAIKRQAVGGACEAWPLARPSDANDFRGVSLYIDEIGALRARPRNARAEALAAACGLHGVAIHGDAYVGRCARSPMGGVRNDDFRESELLPESAWVLAARRTHTEMAAERGLGDDEHLASGGDGEGGAYSWTQTEEDVEVRVLRGIPESGGKKRIKVSYGKGQALVVSVDGAEVLALAKLFDRVAPDECSWSLDGGVLVVTMEKVNARPWADLELPK